MKDGLDINPDRWPEVSSLFSATAALDGPSRGLPYLERAVAGGLFARSTLAGSPHFDALRDTLVFQSLLATAEAGRRKALAEFRNAGGERLLGR